MFNFQRPARRSRPFVMGISRYSDRLTLQLEACRPGPRREAILHERSRVERRFVRMGKLQ